MKVFTVTFFGHRKITNSLDAEEKVYEVTIELLHQKEYIEFLVGNNGEFDLCVARAIRRAKRCYRDDNSSLVLVLPYATAEYLNNKEGLENYYDEIEILHNSSVSHPKAAIQIRNREMVDRADFIVCFLQEDCGGAYKTVEYAKKENKNILNLFVK